MLRWEMLYSLSSKVVKELEIGRLFKVINDPEMISFASGMPDVSLFPIDDIAEASKEVFSSPEMWKYLQYGATEGFTPLISFIIDFHRRRERVDIASDRIVITAGAQQGMDMVGRLFVDPGDEILVGGPTYAGAIASFRPYRPVFLVVPLEEDGMDIEYLEKLLKRGRKPKFLYTIPNFQNPSGITMSLEKRKRLVELSHEYGFLIVEDDAYGELRFRGSRIPSLLSLDEDGGHVIRLGSFSKIFAPGIRIGWLVVPVEEVLMKVVAFKQGMDLSTSTFVQAILSNYLRKVSIEEHIEDIRKRYYKKMFVMKEAIDRYIPDAEYVEPDGGMFLWVRLPGINVRELFDAALGNKVAFTPGDGFYPYEGGDDSLRLCFSLVSEDQIEEGIRRLGKVVKELRGGSSDA